MPRGLFEGMAVEKWPSAQKKHLRTATGTTKSLKVEARGPSAQRCIYDIYGGLALEALGLKGSAVAWASSPTGLLLPGHSQGTALGSIPTR